MYYASQLTISYILGTVFVIVLSSIIGGAITYLWQNKASGEKDLKDNTKKHINQIHSGEVVDERHSQQIANAQKEISGLKDKMVQDIADLKVKISETTLQHKEEIDRVSKEQDRISDVLDGFRDEQMRRDGKIDEKLELLTEIKGSLNTILILFRSSIESIVSNVHQPVEQEAPKVE